MSAVAATRRQAVPIAAAIVVLSLIGVFLGPISLLGATVTGGETCQAVAPNYRAADTREGAGTKLGANSTIDVTVAGVGGVPADATSVKVQLTATELTGAPETFLTMYPAGTTRPGTSNLNPIGEHTSTNGAQPVQVGSNGQISVFNNVGSTHVIVDLVEWCDDHNHDDRYYTKAQIDALVGGSTGVTQEPFEVRLAFGSTTQIAENGPMTLSLSCLRTDPENPIVGEQGRATLRARVFSTEPYLTTKQDAVGLNTANTGLTIERALGSSTDDIPITTSFLPRLSGVGAITDEDGSQISFNGSSTQVTFNVGGEGCYARGYVTMLPPSS